MNCGIKNAVWHVNTWLHPNSQAYALYSKGQLKDLNEHLKGLR